MVKNEKIYDSKINELNEDNKRLQEDYKEIKEKLLEAEQYIYHLEVLVPQEEDTVKNLKLRI